MKDIYVDIRRSGIENYFPNKDMVTVDDLINKIDELDTKIYRLEKENKKYKEVIDKAIEYILKETKSMPVNGCTIRLKELLDILKESGE